MITYPCCEHTVRMCGGYGEAVNTADCGSVTRGFDPHYSPQIQGRRQAVRQRTLTPLCAGSIPAAPAI